MDEYDEINLAVVQVEYESHRERLNERPETARPATKPTSEKSGCGKMLLLLFLSLLFLAAIIISLNKIF
jgi:hypothetical protein